MTRSVQRAAALLLICYIGGVAVVLLATEPTLADDVIGRVEEWLSARGAPGWVT